MIVSSDGVIKSCHDPASGDSSDHGEGSYAMPVLIDPTRVFAYLKIVFDATRL